MQQQLKYRSKIVYWDERNKCVATDSQIKNLKTLGEVARKESFLRFDSTLEFHVYLKLVDLVGSRRILRQYPLLIIPPGYCYSKGKRWKVDFAILDRVDDRLPSQYVEAKGCITTDFCYALACLESFDSDTFDRLSLVFGRSIPTGKIITRLKKTDFNSRIYTLKEFQCTSTLK